MSEQISALMDEEIAVEDAAHLISSMQSSKQSADAWIQYNLIGDVMRGNQLLSKDFKQNLMHKLDQEPTVLAPKSAQSNAEKVAGFKDKLPAKWSIAASVAAVMVVGWMAMHQVQSGNEVPAIEMAQADVVEQAIPNEYMAAHQSSAPSATSYYIQSVSYAE
ncbi:MAG TPA: sigma-E factor negative regulatory protein [Methylotenera sp.]|jgi:sigma-E factor negative regulatory protein RseA